MSQQRCKLVTNIAGFLSTGLDLSLVFAVLCENTTEVLKLARLPVHLSVDDIEIVRCPTDLHEPSLARVQLRVCIFQRHR